MRRLPTIPGRVHGIVAVDPLAVQCDDCLRVWSEKLPILTVQKAIFNKREPGLRLCADCWKKRGWVNTDANGWQRVTKEDGK